MRNTKIRVLTECAIMVALSFALSCIKLFPMPLGGSVTLASMLPIMLIGIKYGSAVGLCTGFLYSLTQLAQALIEGDVFPYCETAGVLVICLLFDYFLPFTLLGIAGIFKEVRLLKKEEISCYIGLILAVAIRFICHYITGVVIWGQWAEGMSPYLYSLLYNGGYLSVDLIICLIVAVILLRTEAIGKLIGVNRKSSKQQTKNA